MDDDDDSHDPKFPRGWWVVPFASGGAVIWIVIVASIF